MESLFEGLSVFGDWYCPASCADAKCTFRYNRMTMTAMWVRLRVSPQLRERETDNEERWHQWSDLSAALLSAACACGRASLRCQLRKMSEMYRQTCILSHKNQKRRKHWERPLLFPLHTFSKTLLFSHSLSQPALLPVIALIQHQPVYLPPPLSGIKVAVIGVIIQLYADSLSLNPLRSALCHAWLTCLRWCQVLAVSRRLPYATVLLSPLMSVRWLSVWAEGRAQCAAAHSRRALWQSHAPSSAVNTDKVAAAQQCRRWVTTKFFLEGKGRTELNIIL